MSLRKSFIKPRPGLSSLADASEKKASASLTMAYGRKYSDKPVDLRDPKPGNSSFTVGGRRLPLPTEGRKHSITKAEITEARRTLAKSNARSSDAKSFGVSSNSLLQQPVPEVFAGLGQKRSAR